jgi:hypothetical protein
LHLETAIAKAAQRVATAGQNVRIADIAAGHGRYVLEATAQLAHKPESILLRDYSEDNVRNCAALIKEENLADIAQSVKGDAFDEDSVATMQPQPTIAIVSGLYELFSDNTLVTRSLRGLARAVQRGGCLIYTGQPWHPQLEFIARTITSHRDHQAWVMRRRTQAELDQLVEHAGFQKIEQWTDEWGIFTVTLAMRC